MTHCPCCPRFRRDDPDVDDLHLVRRDGVGLLHCSGHRPAKPCLHNYVEEGGHTDRCNHHHAAKLDVSPDQSLHDYPEQGSRNASSRRRSRRRAWRRRRRALVALVALLAFLSPFLVAR